MGTLGPKAKAWRPERPRADGVLGEGLATLPHQRGSMRERSCKLRSGVRGGSLALQSFWAYRKDQKTHPAEQISFSFTPQIGV